MTERFIPAISTFWTPLHGVHAVQSASATITFSEPLTSLLVKRVADALRPVAKSTGLLKEEAVQQAIFQIRLGQPPGSPISETNAGTQFSELTGARLSRALQVTATSLRFETQSYTRWVAFEANLRAYLEAALPLISTSVTVSQIGLEYVDLFLAVGPGEPDASLIIERKSSSIANKAFRRREPWHSHAGWFENITADSRRLVNIDVGVLDAQGPEGQRRAVSIRTLESEQIVDPTSARASGIVDVREAMNLFAQLHKSLKSKLADVLTRDARAIISLGQ